MVAALRPLAPAIAEMAGIVADCLRDGGQLLVCGNGGSAADAQHIAAEFVGRFLKERRPWPALALHTNTSAVTAIGNDYGFEETFARQVLAHGHPGDVLWAITTSGSSPNVLRAVEAAREAGMRVVGLSGGEGGPLASACDVCVSVPHASTPRIQEGHILVGHIVCGLVEDELCSETR
ncbi:MAG: D-sedoheptulose 7-phosphate isomerase [Coriobacteriia bacterium]